jgi:hypothetical protein
LHGIRFWIKVPHRIKLLLHFKNKPHIQAEQKYCANNDTNL